MQVSSIPHQVTRLVFDAGQPDEKFRARYEAAVPVLDSEAASPSSIGACVSVLYVYGRRMNRLLARMEIVNAAPLFPDRGVSWKSTVYPGREHCRVRPSSGHRRRERIAG